MKQTVKIGLGDYAITLDRVEDIDELEEQLEAARAELEHLKAMKEDQLTRKDLILAITQSLEIITDNLGSYSKDSLKILCGILSVFINDEDE